MVGEVEDGGHTVSHWEGEGRDPIKRVEMSFNQCKKVTGILDLWRKAA